MVKYEVLRTGCPLTYDDNGNTATRLENGVTTTYSWDMDDKMTGLTTSDSSQSPAHVYAYNGDRLSRTLNGTTWSYLYSKEDILKVVQPGGSLTLTQGPGIDDVLAETVDGTTLYAYKNMLSSVTALFDSRGSVANFYPYDAWGNTSTWPDPATDPNPCGYTGREWDAVAMYYYRYRFYSSAYGRFLHLDPRGFEAGPNLYAYVANQTTTGIDPFGLSGNSVGGVQLCCREIHATPWMNTAAKVFGFKHCWLKTTKKEAGMGRAQGGPLPGCPFGVATKIVDSTGESLKPGSSCEPVPNVDEDCVNNKLQIGKSTGAWSSANNCNTLAEDIMQQCEKCHPSPPPIPPQRWPGGFF